MLTRAIRAVTPDDIEAYLTFRQEMWPIHPAAGDWETVHQKYFNHPHAPQCPGTGLYAYYHGSTIAALMGAYPMPVTLDGTVHAGHMLVDWAVLPRFRNGPVAGRLFETLLALPGRKYASSGTRDSQVLLERRAVKIPAMQVTAVVGPVRAALIRLFHLARSARAAPIPLEELSIPGRVEIALPRDIAAPIPPTTDRTAYVPRGPDFWHAYCAGRLRHGGIGLRVCASNTEATAVVRLLQVGALRFGVLLALRLESHAPSAVREIAASFHAWLTGLGVAALTGTAADTSVAGFLDAVGRMRRRSPAHWWGIPRPSDTFGVSDVRWWLTSADRDTVWGCSELLQS